LSPKEVTFDLPGYHLAAREWGEPEGRPIIALHGWLDNAGTFDLLAPLLSGCRIIAIDSAGHGRSGFRSVDSSYEIWRDVGDVLAVAAALEWSSFSLIGHSRGAAIAMLTAGSFPDAVENLVLIEGGAPFVGQAEDAPRTLAKSILDTSRYVGQTGGRIFATRELAIDERSKGFTSVTIEAAEILAQRSLRQVEGGYQWHVDQRLKAASAIRMSAEQARAFITSTTAPVLICLSDNSPFSHRPEFRSLLANYTNSRLVELEGGHHLHLEGAEEVIAAEIIEFLGLEKTP